MKYLCMVFSDPANPVPLSAAEEGLLAEQALAYDAGFRRSGRVVASEALQPRESASTLKVRGERVLATDGPFIEVKEQLTGFLLIEARDLNEAIEIASGIPPARYGGIEIRPIRDIEAELGRNRI